MNGNLVLYSVWLKQFQNLGFKNPSECLNGVACVLDQLPELYLFLPHWKVFSVNTENNFPYASLKNDRTAHLAGFGSRVNCASFETLTALFLARLAYRHDLSVIGRVTGMLVFGMTPTDDFAISHDDRTDGKLIFLYFLGLLDRLTHEMLIIRIVRPVICWRGG